MIPMIPDSSSVGKPLDKKKKGVYVYGRSEQHHSTDPGWQQRRRVSRQSVGPLSMSMGYFLFLIHPQETLEMIVTS